MTSTPYQSAALDRIIAPWAARIAALFAAIVETILTITEIVCTILHEFGASCRKARLFLALQPGLSQPVMPKLETMDRHARRLRHKAGFLPPPSVSALLCPCPQALAHSQAGRPDGSVRGRW